MLTRIILIDGQRLTDLMIRYGVGVRVRETYKVVEIDGDFFAYDGSDFGFHGYERRVLAVDAATYT